MSSSLLSSLFLFVNYYEYAYERSTFRVDKVLITGENVVLVKNNTNEAWMFYSNSDFL